MKTTKLGITAGLLCLCQLLSLHAQDSTAVNRAYQLKTVLYGYFTDFTTDNLQQIYTIDADNELVKYNIEGVELFRYSNNRLGKLQLVDAANPLNPLLFYPDYQIAIILDRTLNPNTQINLLELTELVQSPAIALGVDNQIWLYDEMNFKLRKLNQSGIITDNSEDLSLLFTGIPDIRQLDANHIYVVANAPETGLLVFDNFGQFDKEIPIKGIEHFQLEDKRLLYQKEGQCFVYDFGPLAERLLQLPFYLDTGEHVRVQKDYLFRLREDRIEVYQLK